MHTNLLRTLCILTIFIGPLKIFPMHFLTVKLKIIYVFNIFSALARTIKINF